MDLARRAELFVASGGNQVEILGECVASGTIDALRAVQLMYEDMYGGHTFNLLPKSAAAWTLLYWGENGLQALVEGMHRTPTGKNRNLTIEILAATAAGAVRERVAMWVKDVSVVDAIMSRTTSSDEMSMVARSLLRDLVINAEEDDLLFAMSSQFMRGPFLDQGGDVIQLLFEALAARWAAVPERVLSDFERLLLAMPDDEPSFQRFFEVNPLLLDPMVAVAYSQPDVFGARAPDFLLHLVDDSFTVVEIETPGKRLITQSGQYSAEATHAIKQAADYIDFLGDRVQPIRQHLHSFRRPNGLVVVGTERDLSEGQRNALRADNATRHGLKVVGFDSLADRARSIRENVVAGPRRVSSRLRIN